MRGTMNAQVGTKAARIGYAPAIPFIFVAGLVAYKWNTAVAVLQRVLAFGAFST